MKMNYGTFVLVTVLFQIWHCFAVVTDDDIKECGNSIFTRVNCTSLNFFYRECPVRGATEVKKIKLSQNFTEEVCEFELSFGFRANAVWVTEGCSGEFYVCYKGDPPATTEKPALSTLEVPRESTENDASNATLYIVIAVILTLLVLVGLIAGCLVKRRQSTEKSRKLAEKRQMSLEARDSRFDEDVQITPIRRHASVESMCFPEGTLDLDKYEKGSICSSKSSTSGFASVSSKTNGRSVTSGRSASGGLSLVLDPGDIRKGKSVPDIRTAYLEQGMKSNGSYKGSQTSLESIREVTSSENAEGQNGSRRRRYIQKPLKFNTVGFRGNCVDNLYNPSRSGLTLPTKRTQTRALVHTRRSSQDSGISRLTKTGSDMDMAFRSHYEDPQDMLNTARVTEDNIYMKDNDVVTPDNRVEFRPISPAASFPDNLYSTVQKPKKPTVAPKPKRDIYASVNKYSVTLPPRAYSPASDTSLEENNNEHLNGTGTDSNRMAEQVSVATKSKVYVDGTNSIRSTVHDSESTRSQNYALMHTFKPTRDYEEVDISAEGTPRLLLSTVKPAKF